MPVSASDVMLAAKQCEVDELQHHTARADLIAALCRLIHALQIERSTTSAYIASTGRYMYEDLVSSLPGSDALAALVLEQFDGEIRNSVFSSSRMLSLFARVLQGLELLPKVRQQTMSLALSGENTVAAYSRLIASHIALVFEAADAARDPAISRLHVALCNLVEGTEYADQERAIGSLAFGAGNCRTAYKQKLSCLVDAQQRHIGLYLDFSNDSAQEHWRAIESNEASAQLAAMRTVMAETSPTSVLDAQAVAHWFNVCSERISEMCEMQCSLVDTLREHSATLALEARHGLLNAGELLDTMRQRGPMASGSDLVQYFLDTDTMGDPFMGFSLLPDIQGEPVYSTFDLLASQCARLASIGEEAGNARPALY